MDEFALESEEPPVNMRHGVAGYKQGCRCRTCQTWNRVRMWRKNNPEMARLQSERWNSDNREKRRVIAKRYCDTNREKIKDNARVRYASDPKKNNEKSKNWRLANADQMKKYYREYRINNRDKVRECKNLCESNRRKNDPDYLMLCRLRGRMSMKIKRGTKSAHTVELLGCSVPEFRHHLEQQFKPGMTWDNYGKWHIDHIRPCASFDLSIPEHQRACFNWTNLQPLWAEENHKKSDKMGVSL